MPYLSNAVMVACISSVVLAELRSSHVRLDGISPLVSVCLNRVEVVVFRFDDMSQLVLHVAIVFVDLYGLTRCE